MNKSPKVVKSSATTRHKWPQQYQVVMIIYSKPGLTREQLSEQMRAKFKPNWDKRSAKIIRKCHNLIITRKDGLITYWPRFKMKPSEARAWMRQAEKGDRYKGQRIDYYWLS